MRPLRAAPVDEVARVVLEGFDRHYRLFRAATARAKEYFEEAAWAEAQQVVQDRIDFYDTRVAECIERLRGEFDAGSLTLDVWKEVKLAYMGLLLEHLQPELAETFFNSVTTRCASLHSASSKYSFARAVAARKRR